MNKPKYQIGEKVWIVSEQYKAEQREVMGEIGRAHV